MRSVQLVKYDFLSSLFVCNKINIIWCWWWYTRTMTCYDDHTFLSHCSIFGYFYTFATVQSNQRAVLWSECVSVCVWLLLYRVKQIGAHQAICSNCRVFYVSMCCACSLFSRFNELIICLIQALIFVFDPLCMLTLFGSLYISFSVVCLCNFFHFLSCFCFSAFYCSNSV